MKKENYLTNANLFKETNTSTKEKLSDSKENYQSLPINISIRNKNQNTIQRKNNLKTKPSGRESLMKLSNENFNTLQISNTEFLKEIHFELEEEFINGNDLEFQNPLKYINNKNIQYKDDDN